MKTTAFGLGTAFFILVSRRSLLHPRSHGFTRFMAWEVLLLLFVMNMETWFQNPLACYQLVSWALLLISIFLVLAGLKLLRDAGKPGAGRHDPLLLSMEKTSRLVTSGLFGCIRHPLYSSLLFLGWGMFFKSPSWTDAGLALLAALFLVMTARIEERENAEYFGDEYVRYMQRTKMFIPYIF